MPKIRLQNGKIALKNGRVSCECCGIPCPTTDLMKFYWGEELEFAILVPITSQERTQYLTYGATVSYGIASSPFAITATRSVNGAHIITGAVAAQTVSLTHSPAACVIQSIAYANWNFSDQFTLGTSIPETTQSSWPLFLQIGFVDSMPDKMLIGFAYLHFVSPVNWGFNPFLPVGYPYYLQWINAGTTQEIDRSQFGFGCSSFRPGLVSDLFEFLLMPNQPMTVVPSGVGFSVAANVSVNGVNAPIQDPAKYYFAHVPSDGTFPALDGNTYTSVVPQGTYTLDSLSASLNVSATIAPLTSAP